MKLEDFGSNLYNGNVTFRIDPAWGIDGSSQKVRLDSKRLNRSTRKSPRSEYQRCKDNQRCSRGWSHYNTTEAVYSFTMQTFAGGQHKDIPLFADFENWRQGTKGWSDSRTKDPLNNSKPRGAHWSPFDFVSLGPSIPSFNTTVNSGLILNARRKLIDEGKQNDWIEEIREYLKWMKVESNTTSLDAETRTRVDILASMNQTYNDYLRLLEKEEKKIAELSRSQCPQHSCRLLFNTSDLMMSGVINSRGTIALTPDGTEVAVWTFDSIDLGFEVEVEVTGQRAMALLSKSSMNIETKFIAHPGTLGGFPGGYSTFREKLYRFVSICDAEEAPKISYKWQCRGDHPISKHRTNAISNNVNGPGSPSVRFYDFR